jgi:hypothetical protein
MNRRWLQVHLSTAVVLTIVAGGLMWANLVMYHEGIAGCCGWPMCYRAELWFGVMWDHGNLAVDIFTAATIITVTAFVCEWRIRRREVRKL